MVLVWPLLSILGMMPYVLSGILVNPVDAFFESVAAVTTTGVSCLDYARGDMMRGLVLWHSILNWLGGLNFIIILSTVLPQVSGCFGLTLSARQSIFFSPVWNKMAESARQGFGVYASLTALSCLLYLAAGLDPFSALTQAMVTLSSSGSAEPGYFLARDSIPLELAAGISMLLSGLNPLLCWKVWDRLSFRLMLRDTELQAYAGLFLASGALVAWNLCRTGTYDAAESLRYGLFQVAAFLSTGGFVSAPCWDWPDFSRLMLFVLVFVGGCIGSAGGGLKVMRLLVLMRMSVTEIRHTLHPHMVVSIKVGRRAARADEDRRPHPVVLLPVPEHLHHLDARHLAFGHQPHAGDGRRGGLPDERGLDGRPLRDLELRGGARLGEALLYLHHDHRSHRDLLVLRAARRRHPLRRAPLVSESIQIERG